MQSVAIIGGGAAGLSCAVMLKQRCPALSVIIYEADERVGKKLAVTGNGRCNITNKNLSKADYHGDADFAARLIENFPFISQQQFFKELGVLFTELEDGKVYPMSFQAPSVVDSLRFKAQELGIVTMLNNKVTEIKRNDGTFLVTANGQTKEFKAVVIACGGEAGGRLGSTDGYTLLKSFGHKIEKVFPSVVQIKTETELVRQLKGIKVDAVVKLESDGGSRTEFGEVLFCDYGLSGPPVLQLSRLANWPNAIASLDLVSDLQQIEIEDEINKRTKNFATRQASELLTGFINKRLGQVILKATGINLNAKCGQISPKEVTKIAAMLKRWQFKVVGTTGMENAQITAGGAQTAQFFDTCMSKKAKGLFAVGEVLDVDGDCGGFNLAFAWASANAAANGIKEYFNL